MNHEPTIATLREMTELMPRTSPHERMVLLTIHAADEAVQMGHVAKRAGITPGAMTTITDRLIESGLIERVRDLGDRRYVHVKVTKKGAKLVSRAEKKATEVAAA